MLDWKRYLPGFNGEAKLREPEPPPMDAAALLEMVGEAVRCYAATIESIAAHGPETPKSLKEDFGFHFRKIREELAHSTPSARLFHDTHKRADAQIRGYGKALEKHVRQYEKDAKEVMTLVASMAESIASQEKQYNVRFKGIARKLRLLTSTEDIGEIRRRLAEEVGHLEKCSEDISRDTRAALDRVNTDLLAICARHNRSPWLDRDADPLTQLPGRPEAVDAIGMRQQAQAAFCVARFAIHRYAQLSEQYRNGAASAVVAEFASRLRAGAGGALLCRWSESEFVVVADTRLPELAAQVSELEGVLNGEYAVPGLRKPLAVECASSAVQPFRGETVDQIMARLEEAKSCCEV
jgi:GGDEF domain-containing protein